LPSRVGCLLGLERSFTSPHDDDPPRTGFAWRNHGVHVTLHAFESLNVAEPQNTAELRYQIWK
jgi:hypothetical protein